MYYTIYKITNTINDKYYIGMHKTTDLDDGYMGSGKFLKRAIKKYGIQNFKKEILHLLNCEDDMRSKEKELVVVSEATYNLTPGGKGGFNPLAPYSENGKKTGLLNAKNFKNGKIKGSQWWFTPEGQRERGKIGIAVLRKKYANGGWTGSGKKHTEESKQKMRKSAVGKQIGNKNSQYGTYWITNGIENKKIKKEELDKWLSIGYNRGRVQSFSRVA